MPAEYYSVNPYEGKVILKTGSVPGTYVTIKLFFSICFVL